MRNDPVNLFVMRQVSYHRVQKRIRMVDLAKGSGIPLGTLSCLLPARRALQIDPAVILRDE